MLVLLSEGGEKKSGCNLNFLLEEFGISVNNGKRLTYIARDATRGEVLRCRRRP